MLSLYYKPQTLGPIWHVISKSGSSCTLAHYNENFDIRTVEIDSVVETGQHHKEGCF